MSSLGFGYINIEDQKAMVKKLVYRIRAKVRVRVLVVT